MCAVSGFVFIEPVSHFLSILHRIEINSVCVCKGGGLYHFSKIFGVTQRGKCYRNFKVKRSNIFVAIGSTEKVRKDFTIFGVV